MISTYLFYFLILVLVTGALSIYQMQKEVPLILHNNPSRKEVWQRIDREIELDTVIGKRLKKMKTVYLVIRNILVLTIILLMITVLSEN